MNLNEVSINLMFFVISTGLLIFLVKNIFYIERFFDFRIGILQKNRVKISFSLLKHLFLDSRYLVPLIILCLPLFLTLKVYYQNEILGQSLKINVLLFLISRVAFLFWRVSQDIYNLKIKSDLELIRLIVVEFSLALIVIAFYLNNGEFGLDLKNGHYKNTLFNVFGLVVSWVSLMLYYHKQGEVSEANDLVRYILDEMNTVNLMVLIVMLFLPLRIYSSSLSYIDGLIPVFLGFVYLNLFFILYALFKRHLPAKSFSIFSRNKKAKVIFLCMLNIVVIIFFSK